MNFHGGLGGLEDTKAELRVRIRKRVELKEFSKTGFDKFDAKQDGLDSLFTMRHALVKHSEMIS